MSEHTAPPGGGAAPNGSGAPGQDEAEPHHWRRIIASWLVVSLVADLLFWFLAGPHIPPGTMTTSAGGAQLDFNVLFVVALPVVIGVWIYMGYSLRIWRASRQPEGPPIRPYKYARGNLPLQVGWMVTTTVVVLAAFVFGTAMLVIPAGAGGGEGPQPIWQPTASYVLPVQVIAQQWKFTYRYPTLGGFETDTLYLPDHTAIAFHVTSLDVIHDFWAYQLGVKADANPGQDNVAYTTTQQLGTFVVRCDELCGIWHGAMFNYGHVLTKSQFANWASTTRATLAANTKYLPPFAWTYTPDANGADGGYYPDSHVPYSKVEVYGAQKVKVTTNGS